MYKSLFSLLLMTLLVTACAPGAKIRDHYPDPAFSGPFDKVLVLTLAGQDFYREEVEDSLVYQLKKLNVDAVARRSLFRASEEITRELAIERLANSDIDGVLVVQLGNVRFTDRGDRNMTSSAMNLRGGYGDYDDFVGYALALGTVPNSRAENTDVDVIANVYDVKGQTRVWSVTTTTANPGSPMTLISVVTDAVVKNLKRDKLI